MTPELANKLADLQKRLLETNDSQALMLFDAVRQLFDAVRQLFDAVRHEIKQDNEWEKILVWAASCQAATAEGYAHRKSAPKSERTRHASICKKLKGMIETGQFTEHRGYEPFASTKQSTLKRLDEAESACIKANV